MRLLVLGGTGFIGRHFIARLAAGQHSVLVPTRHYAKGRDLQVAPTVTLVEADVHDDAALDSLVRQCEAVVNLVGVLHGGRGRPYGAGFARAHVLLPRRIAQACRRHDGVRRLLHVSALGADPQGPSMYLRSKGDGEAVLRDELAGWEGGWTLFRPSIVFGPDDNFTNLFARLARMLPALPVAGADARMQPVYVGDVAAALAAALDDPHAWGKTYELGGPQIYTLGEIARLCAAWSGRRRTVYRLPMALARLEAGLLECLPGEPLLSRDNLDSLSVDNVCEAPLAPELGLVPVAMEAVAPSYLRPMRA